MKKLLVLCAVAFLSLGNMFAFTNIVAGGVKGSVPEYVNNSDPTKQMWLNSSGLNLMYIGCFDDLGISLKESLSCGFGSVKGNYYNSFASPMISPINYSCTELLGVGYGIIRTDKLYLGAFINVGFETSYSGVFNKNNYQGISTELGLLGGDVTVVYTPGRLISFFASFSANVGVGTSSNASVTDFSTKKHPDNVNWDLTWVNPTLVILPVVGVAFKF